MSEDRYTVRAEENDWTDPPETNWHVCRGDKAVALALTEADAKEITATLNQAFDAQEAAGEGVTEEMVNAAVAAYMNQPEHLPFRDAVRAALLTVHPAIFAAGRAQGRDEGLEKAAEEAKQTVGFDGYGNCITRTGEEIATAILSLKGRPA